MGTSGWALAKGVWQHHLFSYSVTDGDNSAVSTASPLTRGAHARPLRCVIFNGMWPLSLMNGLPKMNCWQTNIITSSSPCQLKLLLTKPIGYSS